MKHGKGIEYNDLEKTFEGEFLNGKKNGQGKEYYYFSYNRLLISQTQLKFEGEYLNNWKIKGKEYYKNGKLKFEGEYLVNEKYKGKFYDYN